MRKIRELAGCPPPRTSLGAVEPRKIEQDPTDQALGEFSYASEWRPAKTKTQDAADLLVRLRRRHPVRVNRIVRDLRWLKRKGVERGIRLR